jgi:threonine synthase
VNVAWPGLIEAYRDRLPMAANWTPVTLLEGGTPLVRAPRLSEKTGCTVYIKVEGLNPRGVASLPASPRPRSYFRRT